MISHFHGQLLNVSKLAASLGISPHTVDRYLGVLENTFQIFRLPPYHPNLKKRLVKAPKLYFRDTGLFHYFAKVLDEEALITSPQRRDSFEGYVIDQIVRGANLRKDSSEAFFFRTSDGYEVDLLLHLGKTIIAVEIKSSRAPRREDIGGMLKLQELLPVKHAVVACQGEDTYALTPTIKCFGIEALAGNVSKPFWES